MGEINGRGSGDKAKAERGNVGRRLNRGVRKEERGKGVEKSKGSRNPDRGVEKVAGGEGDPTGEI